MSARTFAKVWGLPSLLRLPQEMGFLPGKVGSGPTYSHVQSPTQVPACSIMEKAPWGPAVEDHSVIQQQQCVGDTRAILLFNNRSVWELSKVACRIHVET